MKRMNKNGFTLVELLIVIAILGIIGGISAPTFIRARDRARVGEVTAQLVADLTRARSNARSSNLDSVISWTNNTKYTATYNGQTLTRTVPSGITLTMPNGNNITYEAPLGERTITADIAFRVTRTGKSDIFEEVVVLGVTGKVYRENANN